MGTRSTLVLAFALSACAAAPQTAKVPRWFIDPSLHPRFSRGTHLTAAASGATEEEARVNATVLLLRQLGGIEGTGGQVNVPGAVCSAGELRLETVIYKPFALSWSHIKMEEGRLGSAFYAFAYLDRIEAAKALDPLMKKAMTRYAAAREGAVGEDHAAFVRLRDAYAAAAGLALELGNITGNRTALEELNQDFIALQTKQALIESGCAKAPEKTTLSL